MLMRLVVETYFISEHEPKARHCILDVGATV